MSGSTISRPKGLYPVVLISHPNCCARARHVNVLFCTSQRQSRHPYPYEVMLNTTDGLDLGKLLRRLDPLDHRVELALNRRGHVGLERRLAIRFKLRELLRLFATD